MGETTIGEEVARGKTKTVFDGGKEGEVILQNMEDITAFDDPTKTKQFPGKARIATKTTCRVFELLKAAGVPVAYIGPESEDSFRAVKCEMLPIEAIARRYAVGSYTKRHPELPETDPPYRFPRLVTELFLKTTRCRVTLADGEDHDLALLVEDPLLIKKYGNWELCNPKEPYWTDSAILVKLDNWLLPANIEEIDPILRQIFLVLEGAWAGLGWRLVDFKIEFGVTPEGQLVVADVVDNDSWRLRDQDWQEMSKQVFRDQLTANAVDLGEVALRYEKVAEMTSQFRIPKQVIVIWCGSFNDFDAISDKLKDTIELPAGIEWGHMFISGHRDTYKVLKSIPLIESTFPDGGVIIDCVGLSNGLGPILSAHTHWPVINVPLTPDDAMSSLRLPGRVPASTMLNLTNAKHQALQILAQRNPAAYAAVRALAETDEGLMA